MNCILNNNKQTSVPDCSEINAVAFLATARSVVCVAVTSDFYASNVSLTMPCSWQLEIL